MAKKKTAAPTTTAANKSVEATTGPNEPAQGGKPDIRILDAARVRKLHDDGRADTAGERLNYWINRAFWLGEQWLWVPSASKGIIELTSTSPKKMREQATQNMIQKAITNNVARLMKTPISMEVMAKAADDYSHNGALTGESLLRQKGLDEDWEVLREKLAVSLLLGGTAALVTDWDPTAVKYGDTVATGDSKLATLSIEDFVVEPGAIDGKYARWWIRRQILPPGQVQSTYQLEEEPSMDGDSGGPFSEKTFSLSTKLSPKKGTLVMTYFERPNYLRKNGAILVVVGTQMVWGKRKDGTSGVQEDGNPVTGCADWIFPFKDHLNIEVGRCIMDSEKWTGETMVTQAIGPQRQLNHMWTKIHENTHRMVGAKLVYNSIHADAMKDVNDDPADPIVLNGPPQMANDPHYLAVPPLPTQALQQIQELKENIQDILGVHNISEGESPGVINSGYGLSLLAEQDSTPVGRIAYELARMFAGTGTNVLELYADKVKETRTTTVVQKGTGTAGHPVKWTGDTLAGQTRAIVPPDSVLPRSHAGMLKTMTELLQMKPDWFPSFSAWANAAMVPGFTDLTSILDVDVSLAEDENYRMAYGEIIRPNTYDDHQKHITQHNNFRKTPEYFKLSTKQRQVLDAHVAAHQADIAQIAGQQTAMAQMHPALGPAGAAGGAVGGGLPPGIPPQQPGGLPPSGATPFVPQQQVPGVPNT